VWEFINAHKQKYDCHWADLHQTHALVTAIEFLYRVNKNPTKGFIAAARSRMDWRMWSPYKSYSLNLSRTPSKVNNLSSTRHCVCDDILIYKYGYILSYVKYPTNRDKTSSETGMAGCQNMKKMCLQEDPANLSYCHYFKLIMHQKGLEEI
jgi:hypothetical protein